MGGVDPRHGGARAHDGIERDDLSIGVLGREPVDEVDLGPDRDRSPARRVGDGLDDVVRRADEIGHLDDLVGALRVHDHEAVWVLGSEPLDLGWLEALMDRAVPLPQQKWRRLDRARFERGDATPWVDDDHVVRAEAELVAGVASEVLVGKEQHLVTALRAAVEAERPPKHRAGVRGGADGSAAVSDKCLQRRRGVHVGDRDDPLDVDEPCQLLEDLLDVICVGHVGHRAAGTEIGQDDYLVGTGEDVGRLGHEVHAAEDDVGGVLLACGVAGERKGVATGIGELHHVVALVVVAEDDEASAERPLGVGDHAMQLLRAGSLVPLGERRLEAKQGGTSSVDASLLAGGDSLVAHPRVCRPRGGSVSPRYQVGVASMVVLERPPSIPDAPGSYQFRDADGRIIYVGKARSLRSRLSSYFQDRAGLHPRTVQMLDRATSVEWIQVQSDVEALLLEYTLIKTHRPRFNVRLVDDKSYPYLAVTLADRWPRAVVMRGAKRPGARYFGPYVHAHAIRSTLDSLLRSFPIRTCSDAKLVRHHRLGRPCLLYHIERCSGPCVDAVEAEAYEGYVAELMAFLGGDTKPVLDRLRAEMHAAAADLEFERAARLRDQLDSVTLAVERQQMVTDRPEDLDVIGIRDDELEAAVQVLHVRRGQVVGRDGFLLEKVEELSGPALVARCLEQQYAETPLDVPPEILVAQLPEELDLYQSWLTNRRGQRRVAIKAPQRGRKASLLATAEQNAEAALTRHRLQRSSDLTSRSQALEQLKLQLDLSSAPLRIECYDMSHFQGTNYVGSMVVMEDGLTKRSDYRRFKVSSVAGNDDYAAMREVLTRRLQHLHEPDDRGRRRFAYPPSLLLLDGGKGQLNVGVQVLEELGLSGGIELAALAKQFEEVYRPGRPEPIRIPRDSPAIYLLQQVRDEAHRYAITFHRERRAKAMTRGALDGVRGLGPERKRRLLKAFGGVGGVRAAALEELTGVDGIPDEVGRAVYRHLHGDGDLALVSEGR
jgi:excinuclease ABC subunit C